MNNTTRWRSHGIENAAARRAALAVVDQAHVKTVDKAVAVMVVVVVGSAGMDKIHQLMEVGHVRIYGRC